MISLDLDFLNNLKEDFRNYKIFIETGTYMGGTIFNMEQYFDELYTIELNEKLYENTKSKYKGDKIRFLLGDSTNLFPTILPEINDDVIFYLDGHWSCGETARGDKDCPLIEELSEINDKFKKRGIVIIDDCRLFGKGQEEGYAHDWTQITSERCINIMQDRITKIYYMDGFSKNDRLILHISDKN